MKLEETRMEKTVKEIREEEEEKKYHVMVVDDNGCQRRVLEALLRKCSHRVTSFESGRKALEYLGIFDHNNPSPPPSLSPHLQVSLSPHLQVNMIITDYSMPGMSGHQLLTQLKKSAWKDIPVVINSSEKVEERIKECIKDGAEKFIMKPIKLKDIEALLPLLSKSFHLSPNLPTKSPCSTAV